MFLCESNCFAFYFCSDLRVFYLWQLSHNDMAKTKNKDLSHNHELKPTKINILCDMLDFFMEKHINALCTV